VPKITGKAGVRLWGGRLPCQKKTSIQKGRSFGKHKSITYIDRTDYSNSQKTKKKNKGLENHKVVKKPIGMGARTKSRERTHGDGVVT